MNSQEEADVLRRIRLGDHNAFEVFVKHHQQTVISTAYFILRDEQKAKDVTQDVFWRFWEMREKIDPQRSVIAYLKQSARNACKNQKRSMKSLSRNQDEYQYFRTTQPVGIEDTLEISELGQHIYAAIDQIPSAATRKAFELSYLSNMSIKEVAVEMDIAVGTAKNQVSKALKLMRQKLGSVYRV